jgi:hypothetical protein
MQAENKVIYEGYGQKRKKVAPKVEAHLSTIAVIFIVVGITFTPLTILVIALCVMKN